MTLPALPEGYRLVALADVDSTNAHAARLAAQGETGPVWVWASEQTAGRGRRGRDWVSKPGNLYATLLMALPVNAATAAQLGFVAALAIHDMIAGFLGNTDALCLKWPNDVLLDGRKVSGILSETVGQDGSGNLLLAVGCGVNLAHAPDDTRYGAISLKAFSQAGGVPPRCGLEALACAFHHWLSLWNNGDGFDAIRQAWTGRSFPAGQPMTISLGAEQAAGRFRGLTTSGALVLEFSDGAERSFHAGEVVSTAVG